MIGVASDGRDGYYFQIHEPHEQNGTITWQMPWGVRERVFENSGEKREGESTNLDTRAIREFDALTAGEELGQEHRFGSWK